MPNTLSSQPQCSRKNPAPGWHPGDPGLGAERASVTYVYSTGRFGGGLAGGLSVLRTVHDPWQAPGNATYVGADFAVLPFIALGPRVGVYRRVSVPTADHPWLVALDFGFGF